MGVVQQYRSVLESAGLAPASINLRLSAIRKLAAEAAENDLLDRSVAQGIVSLKGVRQSGDRAGCWLTREQARDLLAQPEIETTEGKRDRAILAVLLAVRDHTALLVRLIKQSSRNRGTREFLRSELASLRREIKSIDGFCLPA